MHLSELDHATFASRHGHTFTVIDDRVPEGDLLLELVELDEPTSQIGDGVEYQSFAVLFVGPASPLMEQGTWRLSEGGQTMDVFLVPVGPPAGQPDQMRYEAVFNQQVATP